jgi:hypothetical protein
LKTCGRKSAGFFLKKIIHGEKNKKLIVQKPESKEKYLTAAHVVQSGTVLLWPIFVV